MRRSTVLAVALVALTACGGTTLADAPGPPPAVTVTPATATAEALVGLSPEPATARPPQPLGPPLLSTDEIGPWETLVAQAGGEVAVYAAYGDQEPVRNLEATTVIGTPTALAVLEGPERGWARVLVPGRPNGAEGWVETGDMSLFVVHGVVEGDLSERTLRYLENGVEMISTEVGIGSERNPTPTGSFFVTDRVTLADPNSPWGPHALGLSARSETITEFNGGDGIIGIHGTNRPQSIGDAASLGCVRVPNDVIARLHQLVEVGTPVTIIP
jgi:hypothetical protein